MVFFLIFSAAIIIACVFLNQVSGKVGVPALLFFLVLGLLFRNSTDMADVAGSIGNLCTVALIFIMFYGGFGTNWKSARPVVSDAGLLATVGVALTAALTGLFCHYCLRWEWAESFLMGAVISSTDAASVFSILRTRKLGLKNNTASLIEVESGSNDPVSYMLTAVMMSVIAGKATPGMVVWTIFSQLAFGAIFGLVIAQASVFLLRRFKIDNDGFLSMLVLAIAILSYAVPAAVGGNGYLSAYIVGIVMGNNDFHGRKPLIHFFDGVTSMMQIFIFFMLGLLGRPANLAAMFVPAVLIFLFLTLVARPLAVAGVLSPMGGFRKYPLRQQALVSFVGLRGAASIVFAIGVLASGIPTGHDIFSIVFAIVLISIALQGSLIPQVAKSLDMIDKDADVMKTFSDYSDSAEINFGTAYISETSQWKDRSIKEIKMPQGLLVAMILRDGKEIIPDGDTVFRAGDEIVFCTRTFNRKKEPATLIEHPLPHNSKWDGRIVKEYPKREDSLLVMIRRGDEVIVPKGHTELKGGDVLVMLKR